MLGRKSLISALLAATCLLTVAGENHRANNAVFSQIDTIVKQLSSISGLAETHSVPYGRLTKKQLHRFLIRRIKKTLRPEEIRADELALKMFGLVPQDFDLKRNTIDLLTEQAAAFYDYDDKKLFLLAGEPEASETTTLAHELSHALADQHFNLDKYMDEPDLSDDANLARSAVVEGQASWLMLAYQLAANGEGAEPTPSQLQSVEQPTDTAESEYPVLAASPLYVRESLLFPYMEGIRFFDTVHNRLGRKAFTEVFERPPHNSAAIYHPERYLNSWTDTHVGVPLTGREGTMTKISEGEVGEFDHRLLLRLYCSQAEAENLAPHLRGGEFHIYAASKHRPLLAYRSSWDTAEAARTFFSDYSQVLQRKWQHCQIASHTPTSLSGRSEAGYFILTLADGQVSSLEGIWDSELWKRLQPS